jgi:hypothetical protein
VDVSKFFSDDRVRPAELGIKQPVQRTVRPARLDFTDFDCGAVLFIIVFERHFIGRNPVEDDFLRYTLALNRLGDPSLRGALVALLLPRCREGLLAFRVRMS